MRKRSRVRLNPFPILRVPDMFTFPAQTNARTDAAEGKVGMFEGRYPGAGLDPVAPRRLPRARACARYPRTFRTFVRIRTGQNRSLAQ